MNRRETIKTALVAGLGSALLLTECAPAVKDKTLSTKTKQGPYGRTEKEKAHDELVNASTFLTEHELATIAVLCDLILPATTTAGSATDAGVPEFIDFIVKDIPSHQLPIRGGLMWLDHQSRIRFNAVFMMGSKEDQKRLLDEIAYPDEVSPELAQGAEFCSRIRNLVLTGYYTTRMGIDDLGYQGNVANVWDGVPEDVLKMHGMSYEKEWLAKCVDQEKRNVKAEWDEEGNLVS
ncbi:MAG TPA: gluconate 2-dehydrogenase subunit 3 family protein [Saprospiraceae bacterium]|nr:gluconate 2-dehydrogenase subunit 3 family protein [Saprospiraceae bacterium]